MSKYVSKGAKERSYPPVHFNIQALFDILQPLSRKANKADRCLAYALQCDLVVCEVNRTINWFEICLFNDVALQLVSFKKLFDTIKRISCMLIQTHA